MGEFHFTNTYFIYHYAGICILIYLWINWNCMRVVSMTPCQSLQVVFFLRISVTLTYRETHNRILKIGGSSKTDLPSALKDIQHGFKRNWKCWLSTVTVAEDVAPVMPTNPSMQTTTAAVCVCPQIRQVSQKHNTPPIHYSNIIKSSALTFSISIRLNDISKHALFSCWKQPSVDAVFINGWSAKILM